MKSGRFPTILLALLLLAAFPSGDALALWGFGEEKGGSGLDFDQGYDLNTVATVRGRVISVETAGPGPVTIAVRVRGETIHAVAGPEWYWSDRGVDMNPGDEIEITGATAQGKDGRMYIISREISNLSTGESVTLRAEEGRPLWKGGAGGGRGSGMRIQRRFGGGGRGR